MSDEPTIDYEDIPVAVNRMWARLAETIAASVPDILIADGSEAAIRAAWCAEACYWQATGEEKASKVSDIAGRRTLEASET